MPWNEPSNPPNFIVHNYAATKFTQGGQAYWVVTTSSQTRYDDYYEAAQAWCHAAGVPYNPKDW